MSETQRFKYNGHEYRMTLFPKGAVEFGVSSDKEPKVPESLFKYYALNKNSIGALLDSFIFASHPMQLNDKYDCSTSYLDATKVSIDNILKSNLSRVLTQDKIKERYETQKNWILEAYLGHEQNYIFQQFGVISLCENYNDILMWAYYAQNSGFVVKFKVDYLPKKWMGAYPINYVDTIDQIDISEYHPFLAFLYQTNIKSKDWEKEGEWRFLCRNESGKYHPYHNSSDFSSRFSHYDKRSIQEIHLGYDFINPAEIDLSVSNNHYEQVDFKDENSELKMNLLDFVIENTIPCFRIKRNVKVFKLAHQIMKVKKLDKTLYEFEYGGIFE